MTQFVTHTLESAPEDAKATLESTKKSIGFIPNLFATLAESPSALDSYIKLAEVFEKSHLSPAEQQIVMIAASVRHGCEPCVAAHSLVAKKMIKVDAQVVDAIRDQTDIDDKKLRALAFFVTALIDNRGAVSEESVDAFLAAGYSKAQALDVIVGISLKTISNYTNLMTAGVTDKQFASEAWQRT